MSRRAPCGDDHFSRTPVTRRLQQPTRKWVQNGPFRAGPEGPGFFLLGLAPDGVYRAEPVTRSAGELLPHRFTLTDRETPAGGLLSVALSLTLRPVGVTHHRVLWSPDFPPATSAPGPKARQKAADRRSSSPLQSLVFRDDPEKRVYPANPRRLVPPRFFSVLSLPAPSGFARSPNTTYSFPEAPSQHLKAPGATCLSAPPRHILSEPTPDQSRMHHHVR